MSKKVYGDSIPNYLLDQMSPLTTADGVEIHADVGSHEWNVPASHGPRKSSSGGWKKCAHTHPALTFVGPNDKTYTIYGGACGDPIHKNLDIYVALDHSTAHDTQAYPWNGSRQFIYFPITDMSVPKDAEEFTRMISWLADQIHGGKSVHVGCLGGHGRTGMVLAAVVKVMSGEADAITYVRNHYCKKAVETTAQAAWLHEHFGIKVVDGFKSSYHDSNKGWGNLSATAPSKAKNIPVKDYRVNELAKEFSDTAEEVKPFKIGGNIWGMSA
jgi:hypothetical protein